MADAPTVNLVPDFASADDFAKKHTPYITLESKDDVVVVNGKDHYITWIELFAGGAPIARLDLSPEVTHPRFCVPVALAKGTVLRAVEHCNLHGLWAYEVTL
jgi:desulfoferrodoxin-like iron-binding protein